MKNYSLLQFSALIFLLPFVIGCEKKPPQSPSLGTAPDGERGPVLPGSSRGSAAALSPDESRLVVCNREAGSVSVFGITYTAGQDPAVTKIATIDVGNGSESWQAVIAPDNDTAFVVLRKNRKIVRINHLSSGSPSKTAEAAVGSEPTSVALTPRGTLALVTNWVDGTLSIIDTKSMKRRL